MTTVISHLSALRAIRRARRAYSALPWDSVDSEQQAQALAGCIPNNDAIDFGALSILDAWNEDDSELLDLLVSNEDNRRPDKRLLQHILSAPLPEGAIMHVEADIYATSPAMTAMLCSKNESVAKTLMLLMELLGTYSLPPGATYPIAYDAIWPKGDDCAATSDLDCLGDQSATEPQNETRYEQAHYKCEPATTIEELEAVARFAKSSSYTSFRTAVNLARPGSASPAESLMFAVRIHDGNRNNGLKAMGIHVLVINRDQMKDLVALEAFAQTMHRLAGVRFRYRIKGYRKRQAAWLNALRAGIGLAPV